METFEEIVRANICGDGYDAEGRAQRIIDAHHAMKECKLENTKPFCANTIAEALNSAHLYDTWDFIDWIDKHIANGEKERDSECRRIWRYVKLEFMNDVLAAIRNHEKKEEKQ